VPTIRSAVIFSVIAQYSVQGIGFLTIVIVARLLTPAEIGVFAIASGVIIVAMHLRQLGVAQYLVREKEVTEDMIRTSSGVMMVTSLSLGAIIVVAAPAIADFYGEPRMRDVLWVSSLTFVTAPFASVPYALLMREMKFRELFVIRLVSAVVESMVAVSLVWYGMSYMGLVWATVLSGFSQLALIIYYTPAGTPWLPSLKVARNVMQFGVIAVAASVLRRGAEALPDFVLGRAGTMSDVGMFSRGFGAVMFLNQLSIQALKPMVLPYLSEVQRKGESVGDAYVKAAALQTAVTWPMFAGVNLLALPLILLVFGDQWVDAAPIAAALAFWGILQAVHCYAPDGLLAVGGERRMLLMDILIFIVRLTAIVFAAGYGLQAVAWAIVGAGIIEVAIASWATATGLRVSVRALFTALIPSALVSVVCWMSIWATFGWLNKQQDVGHIPAMFASAMVAAVVWVGALLVFRHPLVFEFKRVWQQRRGTVND
jgi:O-antigen/teichoic acid export membrane protein